MIRYLLDTNICIFLIKNRPPAVRERFETHDPAEIVLSSVTLAEMRYGVCKSARPEQNAHALDRLAGLFAVLPFDEPAARAYGELRAGLERAGTPIGSMDMLLAAQALSRGLVMVTNNTREFARVPGLVVEDWTAPLSFPPAT